MDNMNDNDIFTIRAVIIVSIITILYTFSLAAYLLL
jgi:hypothetical protein